MSNALAVRLGIVQSKPRMPKLPPMLATLRPGGTPLEATDWIVPCSARPGFIHRGVACECFFGGPPPEFPEA